MPGRSPPSGCMKDGPARGARDGTDLDCSTFRVLTTDPIRVGKPGKQFCKAGQAGMQSRSPSMQGRQPSRQAPKDSHQGGHASQQGRDASQEGRDASQQDREASQQAGHASLNPRIFRRKSPRKRSIPRNVCLSCIVLCVRIWHPGHGMVKRRDPLQPMRSHPSRSDGAGRNSEIGPPPDAGRLYGPGLPALSSLF